MEKDQTKALLQKAVEDIKNKITTLSKDIESAKLLIESLESKKKEEGIKLSTLEPFLSPIWTQIKYSEEKLIADISFFNQEIARDEIVEILRKVSSMRSWDLATAVIKWNEKFRDIAHNLIRSIASQWILIMVPEPWRKRNFAYQLNTNT